MHWRSTIDAMNDERAAERSPEASEEPHDPHDSHVMKYGASADEVGRCAMCGLADTFGGIKEPCELIAPKQKKHGNRKLLTLIALLAELANFTREIIAQPPDVSETERTQSEWWVEFREWRRVQARKRPRPRKV